MCIHIILTIFTISLLLYFLSKKYEKFDDYYDVDCSEADCSNISCIDLCYISNQSCYTNRKKFCENVVDNCFEQCNSMERTLFLENALNNYSS